MSKRNQFAAFAHPSSSIAKRLKKVETLARSNKPEIKSITYVASGTVVSGAVLNVVATGIVQGTGGNERIGDYVNCVAIEVRGQLDPDVDLHILKANSATLPTDAMYTSGIGTFLLDSERDSRFQEIVHYRNRYNSGPDAACEIKRKLSHRCYYNGSTAASGQRGQVVVGLINQWPSDKSYNFTVRLFYTDA